MIRVDGVNSCVGDDEIGGRHGSLRERGASVERSTDSRAERGCKTRAMHVAK
jgi:hypothetical protein